jgi:anti-sigma factor RsiW
VTCDKVLEIVEAIAAGDVEVDGALREHFETCPRCASTLASARRLETLLVARAKPKAPDGFTQAVLARIRQEQWQSEEQVDRLFNVAIVIALLLVVGSVIALTNVDAALGAAGTVWGMVASASGQAVSAAAPVFLTYVAAIGLLMSALVMWWWADRRVSL